MQNPSSDFIIEWKTAVSTFGQKPKNPKLILQNEETSGEKNLRFDSEQESVTMITKLSISKPEADPPTENEETQQKERYPNIQDTLESDLFLTFIIALS